MKKIFFAAVLFFTLNSFACEYEDLAMRFLVNYIRAPYISAVNGIHTKTLTIGSGNCGVDCWNVAGRSITANAPLRLYISCFESGPFGSSEYPRYAGFLGGGYYQGANTMGYSSPDDIPLKMWLYYRINGGNWVIAKTFTYRTAAEQTVEGRYVELDIDISADYATVDILLFSGTPGARFTGMSGRGVSSLQNSEAQFSDKIQAMWLNNTEVQTLEDSINEESFFSHVQVTLSKHKRPVWK